MMKKINFVFFIFAFHFAWIQNSFCQNNNQAKLDSLRQKLTADSTRIYRVKKVKPLFALDFRNSFIHNSKTSIPVDFYGFQMGLILHEKHNMGIGFYSMSHIQKVNPIVGDQKKLMFINLKMGYMTTFYEYCFNISKRWEIGIPVEVGAGSYQIRATDSSGKRDPTFKDTLRRGILLFGTGFNVDFKVFKWVGLNLMGGIRIVGGNEPKKVNLNGAFYSLGLHFYLGEVVKWYKLGRKRRTYKHEVEKIITSDSFWEKNKK